EREAADAADAAAEGQDLLARVRVPDLHLAGLRGLAAPGGEGVVAVERPAGDRCDAFAVGAERDAQDAAGVAPEGEQAAREEAPEGMPLPVPQARGALVEGPPGLFYLVGQPVRRGPRARPDSPLLNAPNPHPGCPA